MLLEHAKMVAASDGGIDFLKLLNVSYISL